MSTESHVRFMDYLKEGPKKYIVTDPCYLMTHDQWSEALDVVYRPVWLTKGTYDPKPLDGSKPGWKRGIGSTHVMSLWWLPHRVGENAEYKIIAIASVPLGDITYEFEGQTIGFDSGTVCIAEVAEDHVNNLNFAAMYDGYDLAEQAYNMAIAYEYIPYEEEE